MHNHAWPQIDKATITWQVPLHVGDMGDRQTEMDSLWTELSWTEMILLYTTQTDRHEE